MNIVEMEVARRIKAEVEARTKAETNRLFEAAGAAAATAVTANKSVNEAREALRLARTEDVENADTEARVAADLACQKCWDAKQAFKAAIEALAVERKVIAAFAALGVEEGI